MCNYRGVTVAKVSVHVALCTPEGVVLDGCAHVQGPEDLLAKRVDIAVKINHALDVTWLREDGTRGVFAKFRFYTDSKYRLTKKVYQKAQPVFRYSKQFTLPQATQNFLNYLQTNAVVVELWGCPGSKGPSHPRPRSEALSLAATVLSLSPRETRTDEAAEASMEEVMREVAWQEERRHLQETIHRLQLDIDFLQIEKGVLARVSQGEEMFAVLLPAVCCTTTLLFAVLLPCCLLYY